MQRLSPPPPARPLVTAVSRLREKLVKAEKLLSRSIKFINYTVEINETNIAKTEGNRPFNRYFYAFNTHDPNVYYYIIPPVIPSGGSVRAPLQRVSKDGGDHSSANIEVKLTKEDHRTIKDAQVLVLTFNFHEGNERFSKGLVAVLEGLSYGGIRIQR